MRLEKLIRIGTYQVVKFYWEALEELIKIITKKPKKPCFCAKYQLNSQAFYKKGVNMFYRLMLAVSFLIFASMKVEAQEAAFTDAKLDSAVFNQVSEGLMTEEGLDQKHLFQTAGFGYRHPHGHYNFQFRFQPFPVYQHYYRQVICYSKDSYGYAFWGADLIAQYAWSSALNACYQFSRSKACYFAGCTY